VLLRGHVRREGSGLRVTYSLVDPFRSLRVGGAVVDGSAFHLFDLEDQVVASALRTLGVQSSSTSTRQSRPPHPAARERYLQALAYLRRPDNEASVDGAIGLLEQLAESQPDSAIVHAALCRAYLFKHARSKQRIWEGRAATACERAYSLDPKAPEVQLALGAMRFQSGQHQAAREAFNEALRLDPEDYESMLGLTRTHAASGRMAEARMVCERAIALRPTDWRGHHQMGRLCLQAGEFDRAIEPYRRAIELTPDNALSRLHYGTVLYRLDRFDEAADAYRQSLAIQPNAEAYQNLGTVLYFLERYDEAIPFLRKATELMPSDPVPWGNLGNACRWLPGFETETEQALDRAIGLMRERLERDPSQAESWALLAGWLVNRGKRDEARSAIECALTRAPEDVHCMVRAGHVYHVLGDRACALHWFREARRAGFGPEELRRSPDLKGLLSDREFVRILEQAPPSSAADPDVPGGGGLCPDGCRVSGEHRFRIAIPRSRFRNTNKRRPSMFRVTRSMIAVLCLALMTTLILPGCSEKKENTTPASNTPTSADQGCEKGRTLVIDDKLACKDLVASLSCPLSKGLDKDKDHVRWQNVTASPCTLTFAHWPFLEREEPIIVKAGQYSPYFSINAEKDASNHDVVTNGPYTYSLIPDLIGTACGPDVPTVTAGD
jgi:tetratricopeptide (TPR) repeat protein